MQQMETIVDMLKLSGQMSMQVTIWAVSNHDVFLKGT